MARRQYRTVSLDYQVPRSWTIDGKDVRDSESEFVDGLIVLAAEHGMAVEGVSAGPMEDAP